MTTLCPLDVVFTDDVKVACDVVWQMIDRQLQLLAVSRNVALLY